ncbi:MAG: CHAT domain-containing protein [Burkholderiaceae bacterium]
MAEPSITLTLQGREHTPALPSWLAPSARSAGQQEDPFLPAGYLRPTGTFDVAGSARGTAEGVADKTHAAQGDAIVVLELTDGSTFLGNATRLRDTLRQTHPELLGRNGEILLEKLRAEGAAPRGFLGDAAGELISKVYTLVTQPLGDSILDKALELLKGEGVADAAQLGVSWLGTKALMAAIESRLDATPGLYRWVGYGGGPQDLQLPDFAVTSAAERNTRPMLVFIHGTGSTSHGSFGNLRSGDRDLWSMFERQFSGGIFAFEHRTLSQSPIENALALAQALPAGAHVSLVSHSRGGLVADLMCLDAFDALIDNYAYAFEGTGDADPAEAQRVIQEMKAAHANQRADLRRLGQLLRERGIVVQRYVRVASPANGTRLASANFDLFLSGLLTLIGQVPFFFGSPFYSAFKRVVIEIAKNRTNPHLVPGIEAMLPDSPMARLLRDAPVRAGMDMAVIAGDIEGGNLLKRLGVLLTDFLFFDNTDNDLVVDTVAMLAGIAPKAAAKVLFDRGADVSHFRYFTNIDTCTALRDWLVAEQPALIDAFRALPSPQEYADALQAASKRDVAAPDRPVVIVLPGVMGSHLKRGKDDRVWFDPLDIANGGLQKIAFGQSGVEADDLFAMFYGKLCEELASSHRVERFAYDWRQPLDVLAERFGALLDRLLKETTQPIRLLAHSMGGLVVRATIHKRRAVMDELMARDGARLVMLGTPNQGAHSMVENLIGKGDTLRTLVRLDVAHDMQEVLDIVAGFRGALQLLPKPGFTDIFQGQEGGGAMFNFQDAGTWAGFKEKVRDLWFGDGRVGQPTQAVLDAASWLWTADGTDKPSLPAAYESKSVYVFGTARNTPCGVCEEGGRLKMVGTTRGDGTVTWESGRIAGIGGFYYMAAEHGDLPATKEHFPALLDLLTAGTTSRLSMQPAAVRAIEQPTPVTYDAGPPIADDALALQRGLMGGSLRNRLPPRPKRRLQVTVKATDLRFVSRPIMVGHYEHDTIAGPQALIDRELLNGDLSERFNMGLYTGPLGTATSVLRVPNAYEDRRGRLTGAIVTGLGRYDGALSLPTLTEAVRTGVLRFLLQTADVLGKGEREMSLATLLLGYNSNANLTIPASVEALVRGVIEANAKFHETTRLNIRVTRLDIVELYLDTAISAVYALRQLAPRLASMAERMGTSLQLRSELEKGEGYRQRLFDGPGYSYWPRLIITDANRPEDERASMAQLAQSQTAARDASRIVLADRLHFLYVGQRARAESVVQQRQPGLIEKLVRQQIGTPVWQEDFGRMLFQLMVPHDFKEPARQLDRVVLVVDSTTANLPWELMLADDPLHTDDDKRPLALRTAVVRQLATNTFRRQVREGISRTALVVGNPSCAGFVEAFPGTPERPMTAPPALPGAESEAAGVAAVFKGLGYEVVQVIGDDAPAKDVLAALYRRPYRFMHISAHGVFDLMHSDGLRRSGVVLSDGLLITAAEIAAMETVPEVVFLNCCHLGKVEFGREGNKLAASIARELIEIGVRCVVVAGWAVSDDKAQRFGEAFYEQLMLRRQPFGDAVFEARKRVWNLDKSDITWGAFQAYGEPGWLAEPRADGAGGPDMDSTYASPEELLDELARIRADLTRNRERQDERSLRAQALRIETLLKGRCPPGWLVFPQLQSAIGATWYALNLLEKARVSYLLAVQAEDHAGQVPIRDIEKLANIEARLGTARGTLEGAAGTAVGTESGQALIETAIGRLDGLNTLLSARAQPGSAPARLFNAERSALLGSAYKRLADLHAQRVLSQHASAKERTLSGDAMAAALLESAAAYRAAERNPGSGQFVPYPSLNRLAIEALMAESPDSPRAAAIDVARQCAISAAKDDTGDIGPWNDVIPVDALLVERMLDGTLGATGNIGLTVLNEIAQAYASSLSNVLMKPSQMDSMVSQMELLARFADALALTGDAKRRLPLGRMADRLGQLAQRVHPGRVRRSDRPAAESAAVAAAIAESPPASVSPPRPATTSKPAVRKRSAASKKAPAKRAPARKTKAARK